MLHERCTAETATAGNQQDSRSPDTHVRDGCHLVVTWAAGINNGILLIRNSEWSRRFWGEVTSHATTEVRRTASQPSGSAAKLALWPVRVHTSEPACPVPACLWRVHDWGAVGESQATLTNVLAGSSPVAA